MSYSLHIALYMPGRYSKKLPNVSHVLLFRDAWHNLGDMNSKDCMLEYINKLSEINEDWEKEVFGGIVLRILVLFMLYTPFIVCSPRVKVKCACLIFCFSGLLSRYSIATHQALTLHFMLGLVVFLIISVHTPV